MRILILLTLFWSPLPLVHPVSGQPAKKLVLSLRQCEELALKNNPLLKAAEMGLERSRARKIQASNAGLLPKLELRNIWSSVPRARAVYTETGVLTSPDTSTGFSDLRLFTELELSLLQPIYTFGKISGLNEAASFGVAADEANLEKKASEVCLQTRQLYWALVLGKELVAVLEDTRKDLNKAEDKLNEMLDEGSGDVTDNDLFKLKIFKYELDKKYREALRRNKTAASALRATLGLGENIAFELDTEYLEPVDVAIDSLPKYIALALRNRPELDQLRAGLGATRAMVGVSRSDFYPQFFLAGGVKYNFAQDRDDPRNPWVYNPTNFFRPALLLGMKMNLNFVQTRDKVRIAQTQYDELASKEKLLVENIKLTVQRKYLELLGARENIAESEKALKASENWLRSVSMTFDIGLAEVKELIDAYKANGAMQGEHLQNIFKFNTIVAELSEEIGYDLYK